MNIFSLLSFVIVARSMVIYLEIEDTIFLVYLTFDINVQQSRITSWKYGMLALLIVDAFGTTGIM